MFIGLRPVEFVWLLAALAILAQQLIVRQGVFDPTAFGVMAFFVGMIPAGRADRQKRDDREEASKAPLPSVLDIAKKSVKDYLDREEQERGDK